jgi:hypothetical protein
MTILLKFPFKIKHRSPEKKYRPFPKDMKKYGRNDVFCSAVDKSRPYSEDED